MPLKEIKIDNETVLVEVSDLSVERQGAGRGAASGAERFEYTDAGDDADMAGRIRGLLGVLARPVQQTLKTAGAAEWTMEVNFGFKGESGVPFVAKGEVNGAVKVIAKWTRDG
jgi:hypothetical protein